MTFWKTKKFSELEKEWNDILAKTGFVDVEESINGERKLKQYSSNVYRTTNQIYIQSKIEYFNLIVENTHNDHCMPPRDKLIMKLYGMGTKQKDIINALIEMGEPCSRMTITRTLTRYLHKWRIPILKPRTSK